MLYYEELEQLVFTRYKSFSCDELLILSGYVGPSPVHLLKEMPFNTKIIYGMYGNEGINKKLHDALLHEEKQLTNVQIYYSLIPIHSKCYLWKYNKRAVYALVGSANFTANGLKTPYKEILVEPTKDTLNELSNYCDLVLSQTIPCNEAEIITDRVVGAENNPSSDVVLKNVDCCSMPLYIIENGKETVPLSSGLNWGMAKLNGSHVNINDAYIKIDNTMIEKFPHLFPPKKERPLNQDSIVRKNHRHNDNIEIIWDDGKTMTGLMEGSTYKTEKGLSVLYPKEISSTPKKAELGRYIRNRLGVPEGSHITMTDFERYGRKTIDVSLIGEGIYYFDFSSYGINRTIPHLPNVRILNNSRINNQISEINKQGENKGKKTASHKTMERERSGSPGHALHNTSLREAVDYEIVVKRGIKVVHKKYGVGIVSKVREGFVMVDFQGEKKQFQFPDGFNKGYLTLL